MSASKKVKEEGLESLAWVSRQLGEKENGNPEVGVGTLANWEKEKPELFYVVLVGLRTLRDEAIAERMRKT